MPVLSETLLAFLVMMSFGVILAGLACWAFLRLVDGLEGAVKELRFQNRDLVKACISMAAARPAYELAHGMEATDREERTGTEEGVPIANGRQPRVRMQQGPV